MGSKEELYDNLKRSPEESVQEFSSIFIKVYNSIPIEITLRPPKVGFSSYPDGFSVEMAYQSGERNPTILEEMEKNIIGVEANLLNKKTKMNAEKKGEVKEEPSSSSNRKLDVMMKAMENLVERLTLENKVVVREQ